jgi:hypothetical protein
MAASPETSLKAEHLAEALSFGPIFDAPFIDCGQDDAGSQAGVCPQDPLDIRLERSFVDDIALAQYIK